MMCEIIDIRYDSLRKSLQKYIFVVQKWNLQKGLYRGLSVENF